MNSKKLISFASGITLLLTLTNLVSMNLPEKASAARINNEPNVSATPVSSYNITDLGMNPIDSRIDIDSQGNKVVVWSYSSYDSNTNTICNGIHLQKFNLADLPLTAIRTVAENCSSGNSSHYYRDPDVSTDNFGDYIVTWMETETSVNPSTSTVNAVLVSSDNQIRDTFQVNQGMESYVSGGAPRVLINKNSPRDNVNFAIAWYNCSDGTGNYCWNAGYDGFIKTNIYEADFSGEAPTHSLIGGGIINNDSLNYYAPPQIPSISFSNDAYMVVWDGYDSVDSGNWNQAVHGRIIKADGTMPENNLQISDLNLDSLNPSVGGALRIMPEEATTNVHNVFYIAWDGLDQLGNRNVFMKKYTCNGNFECSPSSRTTYNNNTPQTESVTVKVNQNSNQPVNPHIIVSQNAHDIRKNYGKENTSTDQINVIWGEQSISGNNSILSQNFNRNMARLGEQVTIQNNIGGGIIGFVPVANTAGGFDLTSNNNSINQDALYSILVQGNTDLQIRTFNHDQFKQSDETLIHAPDRVNTQSNPAVATSSDSHSVMVYENYNGTDKDIIFSLYDSNGIAIKNTTIATSTTDGGQINPSVAFFNEPSGSADFDKFIISWEGYGNGDNNGIYYRIFNADGTPQGDEILANDNVSDNQSHPSISAGAFGQFIISYLENNVSGISVKLFYHNNISSSITNLYTSSDTTLLNPKVFLNPLTNNNSIDQSQFAVVYETQLDVISHNVYIYEGDLTGTGTVTINNQNVINLNGHGSDVSGANLSSLSNIHNAPPANGARNPFLYAVSYIDNTDHQTKVNLYTFGQGQLPNGEISVSDSPDEDNLSTRLSVDPATGNILVTWISLNNFSQYIDQTRVAYPDTPGLFNTGDYLFDFDSFETTRIASASSYPSYFILEQKNSRIPITTTDNLIKLITGHILNATINDTSETIELDPGSGLHPKVGQTIILQSNHNGGGGQGTISSVTNDNLFDANFQGNSFQAGDDIILITPVTSVDNGVTLHVSNDDGNAYSIGDKIFGVGINNDGNPTGDKALGTITGIAADGSTIDVSTTSGDFTNTNFVATYSEQLNLNPNPTITQLKGQFLRFRKADDNSTTYLDQFGPNILINKYPLYNEGISQQAISYDSRNSIDDKKFAIALYAVNATPESPYIDQTGVYRQTFSDPFSLGTSGSALSNAVQQINPGGKYIIVPSLIDFGDVVKGSVSRVRFRDLERNGNGINYLQVADLDGTPFDLTVTMTDLTNTSPAGGTITKDHVAIFNNDGNTLTPAVTTKYSFTDVGDITLDPSSEKKNDSEITSYLSGPVTLLKKNNGNTGIYDTYPEVVLFSDPADKSGIYNGTMVFTLN